MRLLSATFRYRGWHLLNFFVTLFVTFVTFVSFVSKISGIGAICGLPRTRFFISGFFAATANLEPL